MAVEYQNLLKELNVPHATDVPLGPLTWYGVGGRARVLAHPSSLQQLSALAQRCHEADVPVRVLGAGANLLVSDEGVDAVVVRLDDRCWKQMRIEGNLVTVGAGFDLSKLVLDTARAGLSGLECLAGIPATVGGAIRMNAGGAYGDVGRSVRRVQVMDGAGQVYFRDRDDLVFSYRKTNIVAPFILEAELELTVEEPEVVMKRVKEIFLYKKSTQPLGDHSAGCAFRNPAEGSAGQYIDRAGLKGFRIGGAEVSRIHANFIVAVDRSCTAADILAVIDHVQKTVQEDFGVTLEREVMIWK